MRTEKSSPSLSGCRKKQLKSRIQCYQRLQGIHWPTCKRLKVTGVQLFSEEPNFDATSGNMPGVVSSPDAVQEALKEYWSPVYGLKPIDTDKAQKLLKFYAKHNRHLFEFSDL